MQIARKIEGLSLKHMVIIAACLALLILLWSNRALIGVKVADANGWA